MNFDPFIDYELLDQASADELHLAAKEHRDAVDDFVADEHASIHKAKLVLQKVDAVDKTATKILTDLWTVPVMVHVAGALQISDNAGFLLLARGCQDSAQSSSLRPHEP